jgi:hypothetical protein
MPVQMWESGSQIVSKNPCVLLMFSGSWHALWSYFLSAFLLPERIIDQIKLLKLKPIPGAAFRITTTGSDQKFSCSDSVSFFTVNGFILFQDKMYKRFLNMIS